MPNKAPLRFKPLWMIHNATYRRLNRQGKKALFERYCRKLAEVLRLKRNARR